MSPPAEHATCSSNQHSTLRGAHRHLTWLLLATVLLGASGCSFFGIPRPASLQEHHEVDFTEALAFARRSEAAYFEPDAIRERFANSTVVVEDLAVSNVRFFVATEEAAQVQHIAIRGTDNLTNIQVDSTVAPMIDSRLQIHLHQGFADAGRELYGQVKPHLRPGFDLTITGHSLGGALAAILGLYLQSDGLPVTRIITFGQPKITNLAGAHEYDSLPIIRFVNLNDPVSDVPPALGLTDPSWNYSHFGPEVILWTGNRYIYVEEHQVLSTDIAMFWANLGSHDVDMHKMNAYLENLGAKLSGAQEIPFQDRARFPIPEGS